MCYKRLGCGSGDWPRGLLGVAVARAGLKGRRERKRKKKGPVGLPLGRDSGTSSFLLMVD